MINSNERELRPGAIREGEPKPLVFVIAQEFEHAPMVGDVWQISSAISNAFESTTGRRILYQEEVGHTYGQARKEAAERSKGFQYFIADAILSPLLQRHPNKNVLDEYLGILAEKGDTAVIDERLIPFNLLQRYFLYRELDRLKERYDFEFRIEGHSPRIDAQIDQHVRNTDSSGREMKTDWNNGNFDDTLFKNKQWYQRRRTLQYAREPEIESEWKDMTKALMRGKEGGAIVGLFGITHPAPLVGVLQRSFQRAPVHAEEKAIVGTGKYELLIDSALRRKEAPDDVLYARDLFVKRAHEDLFTHFDNRRKMSVPAYTYHEIGVTLSQIADSYSLEEIRAICEEQRGLVDLLKNHPSAAAVDPFLS